MIKQIIIVAVGVICFALLWTYYKWGFVKSNVKKTIINKTDRTISSKTKTLDLSQMPIATYSASTKNKNNLELLFSIAGLLNTTGRFNEFSVTLNVDTVWQKSNINVSINASSIYTNNKMRDESLVSDDFFDTKKYPEIKFVSDSITLGDTSLIAHGKLELMGKINTLNFPFIYYGNTKNNIGQFVYVFEGQFDFDRTKYGMLHETGVGDMVHVSFYVDLMENKYAKSMR